MRIAENLRRTKIVMGRSGCGFALAICLLFGIYLFRESEFRAAADFWVISDQMTRADAIVILGGNYQFRPLIAAELYHKDLAPKILISQTGAVPELPTLSDTELGRTVLLSRGIPPNVLETFGTANKNTRDEAVALRDWVRSHAVSRLIIPTEKFSARRVRWIFNREFSGTTISIEVPSFEVPGYTTREWWKSDQGIIAFQNELLKYFYYRIKY